MKSRFVEFRQIRFFVTLSEELHFGRAAAREHIVQSSLSAHIRRLERDLGVRLFQRDTHHVELTAAGAAFLGHARQLLADAQRAAEAARSAGAPSATLRVAVGDVSCDSMTQILDDVQTRWPDLEIHQVEAGVPEQLRMLATDQLDVGFGRASLAPPEVGSRLVRLDRLGVLVAEQHPLARRASVPVGMLARELLLLSSDDRAPEFNEFVRELCRNAGFTPALYRGTVCSLRAAAGLAAQGRCVPFVPSSCAAGLPGTVWKPLTEPSASYPVSVLWQEGRRSAPVDAVISSALSLAAERGWLEGAGQAQLAGRTLAPPFGDRRAS